MRQRLCGLWSVPVLLVVLLLAACASRTGSGVAYTADTTPAVAPTHYYPPPGPPDDPWGPYIRQAATRYGIPGQWIRAVMHQESDGEEQAVSPVGAIGLMQVMPGTYDELRDENGLGSDPFNPRDNILAGASYIKQMYDRYGSPGFLAAYNAGPGEVDSYLAGGGSLPDETVNYLAAITPNLGNDVPFSGPLAQYASLSGGVTPTRVSFATGCDVNAAYDPGHPCAAAPPAPDVGAPASVVAAAAGGCDADMAYDPDSPCRAVAAAPGASSGAAGSCDTDIAYDPDNPCRPVAQPAPMQQAEVEPATVAETDTGSALYQPAVAAAVPLAHIVPTPARTAAPAPAPMRAPGSWAIQVGAFASAGLARAVAEGARAEAPAQLAAATIALPATTPFGGLVLYRARFIDLSAATAIGACASLNRRQLPCIVLPAASG